MNIAIVGCGASALFLSAILDKKFNITIFERNKKIASKLLASGNGRCNLTNIYASPKCYNNESFMAKLFKRVSVDDILNKFKDFGLETVQDSEGRVYPLSNISETVLNILLDNISAKIELNYTVETIKKINGKYKINDYNTLFDIVILASGSSASIIESKQNLCYNYLDSLNLKVNNIKPSLVGFKTKNCYKELIGVRSKALVSLYIDDKLVHCESGEVIFKDGGISGIVIMNMSSYYNRYNSKKARIELDILEGINPINLKGALNPKMYDTILKYNLNPHNIVLDIIGTYSISDAQVISGGVDLSFIDDNFRLKNDNNIYLLGEMLDIDGLCGGYNLTFAFMSAYIVGSELNENKN